MPSEIPKIYLETTVLIDFVEKPKNDPTSRVMASVLEAACADTPLCRLVTSVLTMSEVFYAKREADKGALSKEVQEIIDNLWHPDSSPIEPIAVHEIIAREAQELLRGRVKSGWTKTKGADGIHLITAKREGATEFWTTERKMKRWGEGLGFRICTPHDAFLVKEDDAPLYKQGKHGKS